MELSTTGRGCAVAESRPLRLLAALLAVFAWLAAACAPPAPAAAPLRQVTILYTGYGRGVTAPAVPAACG